MEEESLGPYMGRLGGWIALLVFGIMFAIVGCLYTCGCKDNYRAWWAEKVFRGRACVDRPRRDVTEWEKRDPKVWCLGVTSTVFGSILLIAFGATMIASQEYFHHGFDAVACDTWLTMTGHFFGTDELTLKPQMVSGWKGAQEQFDKMQELAYYVEPKEGNCIREQVVDHFETIKPGLIEAMDEVVERCEAERPVMKDFMRQLKELSCADVGGCQNDTSYPEAGMLHVLLDDTFDAKLLEYIEEIQETTLVGLDLMQENIDKYLSSESILLKEGYKSATTALTALADVNFALTANAHIKCPNDAATCAIKDWFPPHLKKMEDLGTFLKDNVEETLEIIDHFIENITISTMDELLELGRDALANFDCQFIGTSLEYGTAEGLCTLVFPEPALTGICALMLFFCGYIGLFCAWKVWHYLRDLEAAHKEAEGTPSVKGVGDEGTAEDSEAPPEPSADPSADRGPAEPASYFDDDEESAEDATKGVGWSQKSFGAAWERSE
eukprot:Polyplicarium_translucidae@DN2746_c0_g1_i5.p1